MLKLFIWVHTCICEIATFIIVIQSADWFVCLFVCLHCEVLRINIRCFRIRASMWISSSASPSSGAGARERRRREGDKWLWRFPKPRPWISGEDTSIPREHNEDSKEYSAIQFLPFSHFSPLYVLPRRRLLPACLPFVRSAGVLLVLLEANKKPSFNLAFLVLFLTVLYYFKAFICFVQPYLCLLIENSSAFKVPRISLLSINSSHLFLHVRFDITAGVFILYCILFYNEYCRVRYSSYEDYM